MVNKILDGLIGVCVGDALGVPVEFEDREKLRYAPVSGMIGFKVHNQIPGTWSDDSSLTLCLAESLCKGYDPKDIGEKFCKWLFKGYWTPHGRAFDVGGTTHAAINAISKGVNPIEAGGRLQYDNGNGSLMRILPIAFYVKNMKDDEKYRIVEEVSSITHAHIRSLIACGIYVQIVINVLNGDDLRTGYENMKKSILNHYSSEKEELKHFSRLLENDISKLKKEEIKSGGYVVETLEASLWCLLNTSSYKEAVLTSVNLGGDTDTTGAVTGGLAGVYYGYENIPKEWIEQLARNLEIMDLADKLNETLKP